MADPQHFLLSELICHWVFRRSGSDVEIGSVEGFPHGLKGARHAILLAWQLKRDVPEPEKSGLLYGLLL
jgi:hypothetical protein